MHILNGRLYYSPNCTRAVCEPTVGTPEENPFVPLPQLSKGLCFRNAMDLDIGEYWKPRWWTRPWGWISFSISLAIRCSSLASLLFKWLQIFDALQCGRELGTIGPRTELCHASPSAPLRCPCTAANESTRFWLQQIPFSSQRGHAIDLQIERLVLCLDCTPFVPHSMRGNC